MYDSDIPGWMRLEDLSVLHKLASLVPEDGSILEVGCFLGRSTSALYAGKKESVTLTVVDTFQTHTGYGTDYDMFRERIAENGDKYIDAFGDRNLYYAARDIARKEGSWLNGFRYCVGEEIYNSIHLNKTKFEDFTCGNYDMVFIDASHKFEDAKSDISRFIGNQRTLIVGDDFVRTHYGVAQAILENRRGEINGKSTKRLLIVPQDSKIWILVPVEGYWKQQFRNSNSCFFE